MRGKHGGHAWVRANLGANRHVTHDQRTNTSTTVNLPTPLVLQPVNHSAPTHRIPNTIQPSLYCCFSSFGTSSTPSRNPTIVSQ